MNAEEKLKKHEVELADLHVQYKKLGERIQRKAKDIEKLQLEINKDNLKDPVWLIQNPTMPGVHEAINELFERDYGGIYNGPHPSGYLQDDDYRPIQKNFEFWFKDYGAETKYDERKRNCEHFLENYLHILNPVMEISCRYGDRFPEMKVVPFQFRSEDYGLDYLGYNPEDGCWYHFTMVYRRTDIERRFSNFSDAFHFAYRLSNSNSDDD